MRKKIFGFITMTCAAFVLSNCESVTDQFNPSAITGENFYKTAADADAAIISCYDAFQSPSRYVMWGDARTDMFASTDRSLLDEFQLVNGDVNAANGYTNWDIMYNAIKRTNSVIKNVPGIADVSLRDRKERIMGEAYFLRAMAYFYLVRTFDNVPLILEPYESPSQNFFPSQAQPAEIFAQIESDLVAASARLSHVPYNSTIQNKGRATKGSARAALSDLYLWNKKYQQAADTALAVINSPAPYTLVSGANFGTLYTAKNTSESIWEIQFNNTFQEGNNNNLVEIFLPLGGIGYQGGNRRLQPSAKLIASYAPEDLRIPATFKDTGPVPAPWRDPNLIYVNKYFGTLANQNSVRFQDANQIIYRLADVILMRAEALNELGMTGDAIALLDQIRTRAGIPPTTATTADEVRLAIEEERFRELAFEGKRYYDLKRTGRYADVTGNTNPDWLRWPITLTELPPRNPNIKQNSGY